MDQKMKVAIVTGAKTGIGQAVARLLIKEKIKVVLSDILPIEDLANELASNNNEAIGIKCDITNEKDVKNLMHETIKRFGRIDIFINVAGVSDARPVDKITEKDWDFVMNVNAKGVFLTNREVISYMMEQKSGKIVNVSSDAGKVGYAGLSHYCASKFAVIGFTQALAKEMSKFNVNVNAVCPGMVYTPMWEKLINTSEYTHLIFPSIGEQRKKGIVDPKEIFVSACKEANLLGRPQSAEDVANMIIYLASEKAGNITGQAINVDGGAVLH